MRSIIKILLFISIITTILFANPVRIMPLGDSITQGINGSLPEPYQSAYRSYLWDLLNNADYDIDFVGSQDQGYALSPPFDYNHEGYSWWTTQNIADHVYGFLANNPCDIILLHIGSNDVSPYQSNSSSVTGLNNILNYIDYYERDYNHPIRVVLTTIIQRTTYHQTLRDYNRNLIALANARIANGDKITLIDMEYGAGLNYNNYSDSVHPDYSGYYKMATVWFNALKSLLPPPQSLLPPPPKSDFNDDNHSDILWKKGATGGHTVWTMNENGKSGIIELAVPNSRARGIGDFNGDGIADVLWQLAQDSHVLWLMNLNGTHTEVDIGAPALKAKGVADFNNDGNADIIWEKNNGSYLIWYMNANGYTGELFVGGRDFTFEKTGDFNNDGIADLLMTTTAGTRVIWFMGLNGRTSAKLIGAKDFSIDDVADFDGDGVADILIQSNATGIHFIALMEPTGTRKASIAIGARTLTAVATGDYDGDGKADVLWEDNIQSHIIWTIDENGKKGDIAVGAEGWVVQP